mmetsp:Transcript_13548/g.32778  ORF Transcript_13548/g.32778 Transcript_13548/m.32778 type:complete len:227 (-) Transcript_13548:2410-3090(-)
MSQGANSSAHPQKNPDLQPGCLLTTTQAGPLGPALSGKPKHCSVAVCHNFSLEAKPQPPAKVHRRLKPDIPFPQPIPGVHLPPETAVVLLLSAAELAVLPASPAAIPTLLPPLVLVLPLPLVVALVLLPLRGLRPPPLNLRTFGPVTAVLLAAGSRASCLPPAPCLLLLPDAVSTAGVPCVRVGQHVVATNAATGPPPAGHTMETPPLLPRLLLLDANHPLRPVLG